MIRVTHVVGSLRVGGAEMALVRLLQRLPRGEFESRVIALGRSGPLTPQIEALGIPVRSLELSRRWPSPRKLLELRRLLLEDAPHVVQTWTYEADLIGGLAARWSAGCPVAWRIYRSTRNKKHALTSNRIAAKGCALLARRVPAAIVSCSDLALELHERVGYPRERMLVIPNGFDLADFRPDPTARESVRRELGVPPRAPLIGLFGRFAPQKDFRTFCEAAGQLRARRPDVHFLLAGDGVSPENAELWGLMAGSGLQLRCHLLGLRDDVPRLMAAMDLVTSSSAFGEAFPQVVGEAMACGVPCVVTDVGDSAWVVGGTGRVVRPRNAPMLARAWDDLLSLPWQRLHERGLEARQRVQTLFNIERVVVRYAELYRRLAATPSSAASSPTVATT